MNKTFRRLIKSGFLLCLFFGACGPRETRREIFFRDFGSMKPFVATVDRIEVYKIPDPASFQPHPEMIDRYEIGLCTTTGEKLVLGSPDFDAAETAAFRGQLHFGRAYEFPKVWLDWKSTNGTQPNKSGKEKK